MSSVSPTIPLSNTFTPSSTVQTGKPSRTYLTTYLTRFHNAAWEAPFVLSLTPLSDLSLQRANLSPLAETFGPAPGGFHWSNEVQTSFQLTRVFVTIHNCLSNPRMGPECSCCSYSNLPPTPRAFFSLLDLQTCVSCLSTTAFLHQQSSHSLPRLLFLPSFTVYCIHTP